MNKFLQTFIDSVGTQLNGMNTTIAKMKEENRRQNEGIEKMEKKISNTYEKCENRNDEPKRVHDYQNQDKAVVRGRRRKISSEKEWVKLDINTRVSRRPDCSKNTSKWFLKYIKYQD